MYQRYFGSGVHPGLSGPTTVFQWTGAYCCGSRPTEYNIQGLLEHNTGRILLQYAYSTARGAGTSATIGIQDGSATSLEWVFNGAGQTVGNESTVLFSPVPEPGSVALTGSALMALGYWARRRRA